MLVRKEYIYTYIYYINNINIYIYINEKDVNKNTVYVLKYILLNNLQFFNLTKSGVKSSHEDDSLQQDKHRFPMINAISFYYS